MKELFTGTAFMFYAIALIAMFFHALKKWADGEVDGGLFSWYTQDRRRTVAALLACFSAVAGLILGGVLTNYEDAAQFLACAGAGFASDTLNKQGGTK